MQTADEVSQPTMLEKLVEKITPKKNEDQNQDASFLHVQPGDPRYHKLSQLSSDLIQKKDGLMRSLDITTDIVDLEQQEKEELDNISGP